MPAEALAKAGKILLGFGWQATHNNFTISRYKVMVARLSRSFSEDAHYIQNSNLSVKIVDPVYTSFIGFYSNLCLMKYVYLLQSVPSPNQRYFGLTSDLKNRLKAHNEGRSPHTSKYKPWQLVTYVAFSNESKAVEFEKYLKSGSGRSFANKRF